jgi:hypothetical protein
MSTGKLSKERWKADEPRLLKGRKAMKSRLFFQG